MAATAPNPTVLVADDEEGIRNLLVHWLQHHGYTVAAVRSGREAAQYLEEHGCDMVITDVVMPDGDGFELIAALRKTRRSLRILAISGGGKYLQGPDCVRIARGLGAHAAVMKPFNWEQLKAGMDRALSFDTAIPCSNPAQQRH
jgi:CheY-like chemotaxis protein